MSKLFDFQLRMTDEIYDSILKSSVEDISDATEREIGHALADFIKYDLFNGEVEVFYND